MSETLLFMHTINSLGYNNTTATAFIAAFMVNLHKIK